MKKRRNLIQLISYMGMLCLVLLVGCDNDIEIEDYSKIETVRSSLVLGLESYMSVSEV